MFWHLVFFVGLTVAMYFVSDLLAGFWRRRYRSTRPLRRHRAGATRVTVGADWWPDGMQPPPPGWLDSLTSSV